MGGAAVVGGGCSYGRGCSCGRRLQLWEEAAVMGGDCSYGRRLQLWEEAAVMGGAAVMLEALDTHNCKTSSDQPRPQGDRVQ